MDVQGITFPYAQSFCIWEQKNFSKHYGLLAILGKTNKTELRIPKSSDAFLKTNTLQGKKKSISLTHLINQFNSLACVCVRDRERERRETGVKHIGLCVCN